MRHRPIAKTSKTGTITKRQARKAAVAAKSVARKTKTARKGGKKTGPWSGESLAPPASILERYLGHFGSRGSSNHSSNRNGAGKATAGRKGFRRAS
jgi:hypothetical protein